MIIRVECGGIKGRRGKKMNGIKKDSDKKQRGRSEVRVRITRKK